MPINKPSLAHVQAVLAPLPTPRLFRPPYASWMPGEALPEHGGLSLSVASEMRCRLDSATARELAPGRRHTLRLTLKEGSYRIGHDPQPHSSLAPSTLPTIMPS